jgi:hypothetical protein
MSTAASSTTSVSRGVPPLSLVPLSASINAPTTSASQSTLAASAIPPGSPVGTGAYARVKDVFSALLQKDDSPRPDRVRSSSSAGNIAAIAAPGSPHGMPHKPSALESPKLGVHAYSSSATISAASSPAGTPRIGLPEVPMEKQLRAIYAVFRELHVTRTLSHLKGHLAAVMLNPLYTNQIGRVFSVEVGFYENELLTRYMEFTKARNVNSYYRWMDKAGIDKTKVPSEYFAAMRSYYELVGGFKEFYKEFFNKIKGKFGVEMAPELAIPQDWDGTDITFVLPKQPILTSILHPLAVQFASSFPEQETGDICETLKKELMSELLGDYAVGCLYYGSNTNDVSRGYRAAFYEIVFKIYYSYMEAFIIPGHRSYVRNPREKLALLLIECNQALNGMRNCAQKTCEQFGEIEMPAPEDQAEDNGPGTPKGGDLRGFNDFIGSRAFAAILIAAQESEKPIPLLKKDIIEEVVADASIVKIYPETFLGFALKLVKDVEEGKTIFAKAYSSTGEKQRDDQQAQMYRHLKFLEKYVTSLLRFFHDQMPFIKGMAKDSQST